MYLTDLMAVINEGIKKVVLADNDFLQYKGTPLNGQQANEDAITVSLEYPVDEPDYPGIWITYEDSAPVQIVGISNRELLPSGRLGQRWRFEGNVSFTVFGLTTRECNGIYDLLLRDLGLNRSEYPETQVFKNYLATQPFLALSFNYDSFQPRGASVSQGTPWGTPQIIYERTIEANLVGEYVVDPGTRELVILSDIIVNPRQDLTPARRGLL